jgi:hypothetical protein
MQYRAEPTTPPCQAQQRATQKRASRSIMRAPIDGQGVDGVTAKPPDFGTYRVPGIDRPAQPQLGSRAARDLAV